MMPIMAAGGVFARIIVGVFLPTAATFGAVAIGARFAQGGGKEPHGGHELVHWNALQDADVLEDLIGHRRFCRRSLRAGGRGGEQPGSDCCDFARHGRIIHALAPVAAKIEITAAVSCAPMPCAAAAVNRGAAVLNKGTGHFDCPGEILDDLQIFLETHSASSSASRKCPLPCWDRALPACARWPRYRPALPPAWPGPGRLALPTQWLPPRLQRGSRPASWRCISVSIPRRMGRHIEPIARNGREIRGRVRSASRSPLPKIAISLACACGPVPLMGASNIANARGWPDVRAPVLYLRLTACWSRQPEGPAAPPATTPESPEERVFKRGGAWQRRDDDIGLFGHRSRAGATVASGLRSMRPTFLEANHSRRCEFRPRPDAARKRRP